MLTSVQKEILQTLINLYQSANGGSIKGEDIAEIMSRNPGTIRNQMQSLRSLGLVKGVPGPRGGYKPTVEAYHSLNISVTDKDFNVPIYKDGEKLKDISVAKIEFTSIPQPGECEAAIKVLGNIKDSSLGDTIRIGPTPVNNLGVMGKIVGRDDMDNILLVDTTTIRSIPKNTVGDIDYFKSLGIMIMPGHIYNVGTFKEWAINNTLILISYPEGLNNESQILVDVVEEMRYFLTTQMSELTFDNTGGDEEAVVTY